MDMREIDRQLVEPGAEAGHRYLSNFPQLETFYASDYRRPEYLAAAAGRLVNRTWKTRFDRKATVQALADYADRHPAPSPVIQNIERLADPRCVCVVTGQQAGLGGGPLLTLYKAVTALRLAEEVEIASGQPCVPVFWNASDDSDVEEVNRIRGLDAADNLLKFRFSLAAGRRHVRNIALPGPKDPAWREAEAALGQGRWRDRAAVLLKDAAGRDFGAAFTRLMFDLLGARGLVVIEPKALTGHPAWRRLHALEVEERESHRQALQRVADRLEALGVRPDVPITNRLNLFHTVDGERRHVTSQGKRLVIEGGEEVSKTELLRRVKAEPETFTPNVLLRPLIQNAIFPTAAYVGGASEIAYHGLLKGLHRSAQIFMPVLFPRLSLTLVRPADTEMFDRLLGFRRSLRWRQEEAEIALQSAQKGIKDSFHELRERLQNLGKPTEAELDRLERRTGKGATEILLRVRHEALRLMEGGQEMAPLLRRYFPEDKPQERVLTVLAALAEIGPKLIETVEQSGDVFDFSHRVALID